MACQHNSSQYIHRYGNYKIKQCTDCHLVFQEIQTANHDSNKIYKDYYKNEIVGRFGKPIETIVRLFRFWRTIKIFIITPRAKKILDIGSGRGFLLYFLKKYYGYTRTVGTQIEANSYNFSKQKLNLEIYNQDLLELDFDKGTFDIITMWHVLEHVTKVEKYIQTIYDLLNAEGKVIIEVPNYNSWTSRLTGQYWLGLDLKYHLTFFTPQTLISLLQKNNFRITRRHNFSLEYSTFFSTQSIVNKLTRTSNVFFDWIKNDRQFDSSIVWHTMMFIILAPVCFCINLALFFSSRGEILFIVAEKHNQVEAHLLDAKKV